VGGDLAGSDRYHRRRHTRAFRLASAVTQGGQSAGANAFGVEELDGMRMRAMAYYLRLAAQGTFDLSSLITHRFRLEDYGQAFLAMHAEARHQAVKGMFDFELG
jgi:threonine dehydrogenase-like Zn-dependent dehydrogenase